VVVNVFYITGTNTSTTSVIYTGLFKLYDDKNNVSELNKQVSSNPEIILDPIKPKETAIVTPRLLSAQPLLKKQKTRAKTKTKNKTKAESGIVYIDSDLNRNFLSDGNLKFNSIKK